MGSRLPPWGEASEEQVEGQPGQPGVAPRGSEVRPQRSVRPSSLKEHMRGSLKVTEKYASGRLLLVTPTTFLGFPGGSEGKVSARNAGDLV